MPIYRIPWMWLQLQDRIIVVTMRASCAGDRPFDRGYLMERLTTKAVPLAVTLLCCTLIAASDAIAAAERDPPRPAFSKPFLLAPPKKAGPVVVQVRLCVA